ncbi:type II toxin-antitoxin system HicA family toxin [bacterium]|nr:type II toxin-antitoxin system HicA family toxin [bacterium]
MSKLYSAGKIVKALLRAGCCYVGQRGSHIKMRRKVGNKIRTIIVPNDKEVAHGTFNALLEQAGMTIEEFRSYLR